jgi:hypothetical protein
VPANRPRHPLYPQVAERAQYRCEYCLAPEEFSNKEFHVEHVVPRSSRGPDTLDNLALACFRCNLSKATAQSVRIGRTGATVPLFNPRTDDWSAWFDFVISANDESARIAGKSKIARATATRLKMNVPHAARARWKWFLAYALESEYLSN